MTVSYTVAFGLQVRGKQTATSRRARALGHLNIARGERIVAGILGVDAEQVTITATEIPGTEFEDVHVETVTSDEGDVSSISDTVANPVFTNTAATKLGIDPADLKVTSLPYVASTDIVQASPPPLPPQPPVAPGEEAPTDLDPIDGDKQQTDDGTGALVGGVFAGIVCLLILLACLYFLFHKKRIRRKSLEDQKFASLAEHLHDEHDEHDEEMVVGNSGPRPAALAYPEQTSTRDVELDIVEAEPAAAGVAEVDDKDEEEEYRRLEWIRYYVEQGETDKALELGWDGLPLPARSESGSEYDEEDAGAPKLEKSDSQAVDEANVEPNIERVRENNETRRRI